MNAHINPNPTNETPSGKSVPFIVSLILSLIAAAAAAAAAVINELGLIAMLVFSVITIFTVSAKVPVPIILIPIIGIIGVYFWGGTALLIATVSLWISSLLAGIAIRTGGDFHRALLMFIFVLFACAVVCAAMYTRIAGITASDISEAIKSAIHDILSDAVSVAGNTMSLDNAMLLTEQYEVVAETAVLYIPAVIGFACGVGGILSIRLAGFIHDLTGCTVYPHDRRMARVDRIFAVIYAVTLILGALDGGIVGVCASNIMIILMVPAAAAGVSYNRTVLRKRREAGMRGLPFSLILLILSFFIFTPAVGLMLLSFSGVLTAFSRSAGADSGK